MPAREPDSQGPLTPDEFDGLTCSPQLRLRILHRVSFFEELEHAEVARINELFRERGFTPGEEVIGAGDPAQELFIVATGTLKMQRFTAQGHNVILDLLTAGDLFGSLPLLGEDVYRESVEAQTACCVLGISTEGFRSVLEQYPRISPRVLEFVGGRLREAHEQIRLLSDSDVQQRLAAILLRLDRKLVGGDGGRLDLSQQELAEMAGTTLETTNRTLKRLRDDEVVKTGRGWIQVVDAQRLEELIGD